MYLLEVKADFEAAHRLPDYSGPCRRIHGHHWVVRSLYRVEKLGQGGIAIDLVILKRLLRAAVARYDHQSLNTEMACVPTSENLANTIFQHLKSEDWGRELVQVSVEETPGCIVMYCEEN